MFGSFLWVAFWGLIIWAVVKVTNSNSSKNSETYNRGYSEGYWAAIDTVRQLIAQNRGFLSRDNLDKFLQGPGELDSSDEAIGQAELGSSEDVGASSFATPLVAQTAASNESVVSVSIETNEAKEASVVQPPTQQEVKTRNTMRNLNILLGLGSLLFIAAGIAFIASPMPDIVKLLGVLAIVVAFYGGGIGLYIWSEKLKPAAVAFVGTGLALIPFVAVVLNAYGEVPVQWAWFITSILGILSYGAAAMILQSQVVAYLTIGFLLSFVGSSLTVGDTVMIWYFVSFIALSLLLSTIGYLKPRWLPELFQSAVIHSGQAIAPITLVSSLLVIEHLSLWHYEVLTGLTALYYLVAWLQTKQMAYSHITRALLQITAMIFWADIVNGDMALLALGWIVISIIHQVALMIYASLKKRLSDSYRSAELVWTLVQFSFQMIVQLMWLGREGWAGYFVLLHALWLVLGIVSSIVFRRSGLLTMSIIASLTLPWLVARNLVSPELPMWVVPLLHLLLVATGLGLHHFLSKQRGVGWRVSGVVMVVLQGLLALMFLPFVGAPAVGLILGALALTLVITSSHIYKLPWAMIVLLVVVQFASWPFANLLGLDGAESLIVSSLTSMLIGLAMMATYWILGDRQRGVLLTAVSNLLIVPFAVSLFASNQWLEIDLSRAIGLAVLMMSVSANLITKLLSPEDLGNLRILTMVSYVVHFLIGLSLATTLPIGWLVGVLAIGAALSLELSYSEKAPALVIVTVILMIWMAMVATDLVNIPLVWRAYVVALTCGLIFYTMNWLFWWLGDQDRRKYVLWSSWIVWLFGTLVAVMSVETRLSGALLGLASAATIAVDGWYLVNRRQIEIAAYIGAVATSLLVWSVWPNIDSLVYAHIVSFTIFVMAFYRRKEKNPQSGMSFGVVRAIIAMGLLTYFVGIKALSQGGWYSFLFLVEHIVLLAIGALTSQAWAVRWGIVASVLAVVYYLRESPYVLFAILGSVVIGFVIWRLRRIK